MENQVDLIEKLRQHIDEFVLMFVVGLLSMGIYMLSEKDIPFKARLRLAVMGFLIAMVFSLPVYYGMNAGSLLWLVCITSIFTICGQFLPELLQILFKKFVKKQIKDRFGVSEDDNN